TVCQIGELYIQLRLVLRSLLIVADGHQRVVDIVKLANAGRDLVGDCQSLSQRSSFRSAHGDLEFALIVDREEVEPYVTREHKSRGECEHRYSAYRHAMVQRPGQHRSVTAIQHPHDRRTLLVRRTGCSR